MKRIKLLDAIYQTCESEGFFQFRECVDDYLINSLYVSALGSYDCLNELDFNSGDNEFIYSLLFTNYYAVLRKLIDAYLLFYCVARGLISRPLGCARQCINIVYVWKSLISTSKICQLRKP